MRKRWHVLTLLTVVSPVLATAGMVGIAETREGSYSVIRGESETLVARAQTPVLLNSTDRVATSDSEVRIRMINGSAVFLRNGEVSFPSADVVRVHSGEAAISFPEGSETVVESGDYRFVASEQAQGASSLVVANTEDQRVAARSLRGQFGVRETSTNSQVASIHSVTPASAMLVSTSTSSQGFIPSGLSQGGMNDRSDLFFEPARATPAPPAPVATVASAAPVVPGAASDRRVPATAAETPVIVPNPFDLPGTSGGGAGTSIPTSGSQWKVTPYDLSQPVSSFVTEPGERPSRPRR